MNVAVGIALLLLTALVVYSVYVAVHEPDPQETVILGQRKIASASPAGLRILVRNRASRKPVQGASVILSLSSKTTGLFKLGTFRTGPDGCITDAINIPEIVPGEYQLLVDVTSSLGRDHIARKVEVQHSSRILLSSDKPLYQPGQTIHLRSLIINARTQKPFVNEAVTFEVSDPKGNKVFKETRKASGFGTASADFVLASDLNLGRYAIRAIAGSTSTERTVQIKRYVLPKFRISIATDKPYYLPGQTVSGSVQATYFFGKPVSGGTVDLNVATFQEKPVVIIEMQGRTDETGRYTFQFVLPDFFVGLPQRNEQAFLDLTAQIRDSAQHTEETTLSLSVARSELELVAIPDGGVLVPGIENLLYVLTAYPDGRPAVCRVFLNGTAYQSDAQGVCVIRVVPTTASQQFDFQAIDEAGRKARLTYQAEDKEATPPLLVRTDKAIYQTGETVQLTLLSPEKNNTVFIDVIKDGQTVLTKSVALNHHEAVYALPLPASLAGTLRINAYLITRTGEDRGSSRIIYVNPASGLRIQTQVAKPIYRPGEVARLDFNITDTQGNPAPASLGISAVDESVFALHENRPGLLQQFLDVEGDLLKPRYQIKFFASPERVLFDTKPDQNLALAYFSLLNQRPASPGLDSLVRDKYLSPRILDHVRSMRGTPAYEALRKNPEYVDVLRLAEGEWGNYSLREATGPAKLQTVEAYRKAYFKKLTKYSLLGFGGFIFLLPIFLILYYSRPDAGIYRDALATSQHADYLTVAGSSYNLLGVLTLCPLIFYPLGFLLLEHRHSDRTGWILLLLETAVVLTTVFMQLARIAGLRARRLEEELLPLRAFVIAFLVQFLISRAGFLFFAYHSGQVDGLIPLWFLTSLVTPLIVLGGLGSHLRGQLIDRGITTQLIRITWVEVLVVIMVLGILAAMLMPALNSARGKASGAALMSDLKQIELAKQLADEGGTGASPSPRIRRDFPETLFWQPELITDDQGKASLEIPLADSITTWRTSVDAISALGKMGSTESPITVFQDFFVDVDLPVALSLNDQISMPVTCYNYLKDPQDIHLSLAQANWFEFTGQPVSVHLGPNEVKSVRFPIKVLRVGNHTLRVTAQGSQLADTIEREVRVLPTGDKVQDARNEVLKDKFEDVFIIPSDAIPASESLVVKFYPSRFSEIVEGLDSIFQAPNGCFEQTSSTTYPNVLALDYLKRMGRLTPEIEVKACKFINAGSQRLLTFEVPGGGFDWFGHAPAHVGLTAYGILEFTDMKHVHPVDEAVIDRTRKWLFSKQNADGSWKQADGLHSWSGKTPVTAYVAWALAESGDPSDNLERALNYLRSHPEELASTYEKAVAANAFLARDRNDTFGRELAAQLKEVAIADAERALRWTSKGQSITYSHGSGLDVETTALAAMALMKANLWPESVKQALTWISKNKMANGTWGSTQATILAMRALIHGSTASLGQESESAITLFLNSEKITTFHVNRENSDVMKQIDLTGHLHAGDNRLELRQVPGGELPVQIVGAYWLPTRSSATQTAVVHSDLLQIDLQYDRTTLAVNDQLRCAVTVKNNSDEMINMAIVDLGIPPGFDVDPTAFESMQQDSHIAKFELTGNQVILYLRELSNTVPFQFEYSLRAKYPLRVQTRPSNVYEYYQPQNRAQSAPVSLQVVGN